jgi:hypothetical protein
MYARICDFPEAPNIFIESYVFKDCAILKARANNCSAAVNHNFPETGTQQHYYNMNPTVSMPAIAISLAGQEV